MIDWDGETEWRRIGKKVAMGTKFNELLLFPNYYKKPSSPAYASTLQCFFHEPLPTPFC